MSDENVLEIQDFQVRSQSLFFFIEEFCIQRGKVCAVTAPSGGGKSVLLSLLCGYPFGPMREKDVAIELKTFRIGKAKLSSSMFTNSRRLRDALVGERIVYLPQNFPTDRSQGRQSIDELVDVAAVFAPDKPRACLKKDIVDFGKDLDVSEKVFQRPLSDLSGGERKRVEIIARLCGIKEGSAPESDVIMLLDEPTAGLHAASAKNYYQFIKSAVDKTKSISLTFLISTHDLDALQNSDLFTQVTHVVKKNDLVEQDLQCFYLNLYNTTDEFIQSEDFSELKGAKNE